MASRLSRLDLARWLVARENPLTARVFVNRLWKLFFGTGLSKVLDDFGAQGEPPRNPELLDWLAADFVESGWDTKRMVRLIVTSHAYRQSSNVARRHWCSAIRTIARSRGRAGSGSRRNLCGTMRSAFRGCSCEKLADRASSRTNHQATGRTSISRRGNGRMTPDENQWRRGLYTHWQRSYFHPSLLAFDAPSREECAVERVRSNIPQQALVLLNDPTYVEAARVFAERMLKEGGTVASARINWAFQQALSRPPRADELETLIGLLSKHRLALWSGRRGEADQGRARAGSGRRCAAGACRVDERGARHSQSARNDQSLLNMDLRSEIQSFTGQQLTRRAFLGRASRGLGALALAGLIEPALLETGRAAGIGERASGSINPLDNPPKARRIIYLCMAGGPSHLETFDPKPKLAEMHGQPMPESITKGKQIAQLQGQPLKCFGPQHSFKTLRQRRHRNLRPVSAHRFDRR